MNVVINTSITKSKPIIVVDIDDVLGDYMAMVVDYGNARYGMNLTHDDGSENWGEMFGVSQEEWLNGFEDFCAETEWYKHEKSIKNAREVLEKLRERFQLVVVTSRGISLKQDTLEWLEKNYGGVVDEVIFAGIFDGAERRDKDLHVLARLTKADKLQEIGASYFIDDQPKHVNAAAECGIKSLLFGDYGWNRDAEIVDGVTRVADWEGVADYFGV